MSTEQAGQLYKKNKMKRYGPTFTVHMQDKIKGTMKREVVSWKVGGRDEMQAGGGGVSKPFHFPSSFF